MNDTEPIHEEEPRPVPEASSEQPKSAPAEPPPREPFWGYFDLVLFIGLTLPCMMFGMLAVKALMWIFHFHTSVQLLELLPEQILGYALLFGALRLIFRLEYDRPFWGSLGWTPIGVAPGLVASAGIVAAFGVILAGMLIHLPEGPNRMTDLLLQGKFSLVLLAAFGVGIAPLCEELAFRGFLQPLLVRTFGAVPGILIPAVAFGLLHFQEYGNSWRHALLLSGAGAGFGAMRHYTRSTKAAVLMHASYNAVLFVLLALALATGKGLHS